MATLFTRCRPGRALFVLVWSSMALGHGGHGGKEVGPFDLDAPRRVSPETAAHIGLKTAEVDFGPLEDVLALSGVVRVAPDRHWAVSTRTAGKVLAVYVQIGDRVHPGDLLIEIDSPELAKNIYEVRKLEVDYQKLLVDVVRADGRVEQLRVEAENATVTAELAEAELQRAEAAGEQAISLNALAERRGAALRARGEAKARAVDLQVAVQEAEALRNQAASLRLSRDALLAVANVEPVQDGASGPRTRRGFSHGDARSIARTATQRQGDGRLQGRAETAGRQFRF